MRDDMLRVNSEGDHMDKNRQEITNETLQDKAPETNDDVRTLRDLELLLVGGGGDDVTSW